jgi:hypothetical protein
MIIRIAFAYVLCLFAMELLLFVLVVLLHVSVLMGAARPLAEYGKPLLYCALAVAIPTVGLAEDKNVWKNEVKNCPRWLRIGAVISTVYGGLVASVQVIFLSIGGRLEAQPMLASALPLFLGSVPLCIPYSLLWARPVSGQELIKRVQISLIGLAILLAFVVAARLGYLPFSAK